MSLVTSTNVPYLDGWRGLAILAVFIGHFGPRPATAWLGEFGVQVFFVLSGYLMSNLLFIKKVSIRDFFARRASRVLPVFLLFVFAMVIYAAKWQPVTYLVPMRELLATLSFSRTYFPADLDIFSGAWPIGHLWSLNIEEHSYVFLALGVLALRNLRSKYAAPLFLISTTAAILGFTVYYSGHPPAGASAWQLHSEVAAFGLISAAALRVTVNELPVKWRDAVPSLLPIITLLIAVACYSVATFKGRLPIAALCLAFSINFLHRTPALFRRLLSFGVLRWFGVCSFSLYMWQQPFYLAMLNGDVHPLAGGIAALGVGAVCMYFFENPLRLFLNRAWSGYRQTQGLKSALLRTASEN